MRFHEADEGRAERISPVKRGRGIHNKFSPRKSLDARFEEVLRSALSLARPRGDFVVNKAELIEKVAKKTALTKVQSVEVIDAALDVIAKAVSKGDEVKLVGFGTFSRAVRKSRPGRNPKTGTQLVIPAVKVPKFKAGKDFKDLCK